MMNYGETAARMDALCDREAAHTDPMYKTTLSLFRSWLTAVEMALRDEHVDPEAAQRVLNRLVYATPAGAEAHLRLAGQQMALEQAMHAASPSPLVRP